MLEELLKYPFDENLIIRKKRVIREELLSRKIKYHEYRVAILGGSTTSEIRDILELFLLKKGIKASFYESEYNRYYEEAVFESTSLESFNPDVIFIHTGIVNVDVFPDYSDTEDDVRLKIKNIIDRYLQIWGCLHEKFKCDIIQNNFEMPHVRILGNFDSVDYRGQVNFILNINREFSLAARSNRFLHINDVHYMSSVIGMDGWFDYSFWYLYKYALSFKAIPYFCHNVSNILGAVIGKSRKLAIVDLDNTLWGGVIGDDGVNGIQITPDTPEGEAYHNFQKYLKRLNDRGILLAVSSKNDSSNIREGFSHPDMVLKLEDFASVKATWEQKNRSVQEIVEELNVGINSVVFVDDNPAERELIKGSIPEVAVPDMGNDVVYFSRILDREGYFETVSISDDDILRSEYYRQNSERVYDTAKYAEYGDYLIALEMKAEIKPFSLHHLERIAQLINKTNQFNLTGKRVTRAEIEATLADTQSVALYGTLSDKFGNNGIVSVIVGKIHNQRELHIDIWVMSCRVFKREMEFAMFDELVRHSKSKCIDEIYGHYAATPKNRIFSDLYYKIGFDKESESEDGSSVWRLRLKNGYKSRSQKILIVGGLHE